MSREEAGTISSYSPVPVPEASRDNVLSPAAMVNLDVLRLFVLKHQGGGRLDSRQQDVLLVSIKDMAL